MARVFNLSADPGLGAEFLAGTAKRGIVQLKGAPAGRRHAGLALQRDADPRGSGSRGVPDRAGGDEGLRFR